MDGMHGTGAKRLHILLYNCVSEYLKAYLYDNILYTVKLRECALCWWFVYNVPIRNCSVYAVAEEVKKIAKY